MFYDFHTESLLVGLIAGLEIAGVLVVTFWAKFRLLTRHRRREPEWLDLWDGNNS